LFIRFLKKGWLQFSVYQLRQQIQTHHAAGDGTTSVFSSILLPNPSTKPIQPGSKREYFNSVYPGQLRGKAGHMLADEDKTDQLRAIALLAGGLRRLPPTAPRMPNQSDFALGGKGSRADSFLPKDNLLKRGDILLFCSGWLPASRYWGPYVVGETAAPIWESTDIRMAVVSQP